MSIYQRDIDLSSRLVKLEKASGFILAHDITEIIPYKKKK